MKEITIANIFEIEPFQWGLRGDPLLWKEMKERIVSFINIKTTDDLEKVLHNLFVELTNSKLEKSTDIFVRRYDEGGMSSGYVSCDFWLERGFPILIERFKALSQDL
ncbi:hypothetical protein [Sphingobacterium lumbrici]|uniref:hypothetical protein n=1 Tax=Sphingobacterium lumbrici TaxID=2559600 RepID=UPI001127A435|nr:hypothetical protein [Sphingobacterium lumbrici]